MPSENNLSAVFTDIANAIRAKSGTTEQMKPINMADNITAIKTSSLKTLLDATKSCFYLFKEYKGTSIDGLINYGDTSSVTTFEQMFNYCTNLTSVPLLNTSNATNMRNMFFSCSNLSSIPLFDTSKVNNMSGMFSGCTRLRTIPLLDTSNVTNMADMFTSCNYLETIPEIDVSNVTGFRYTFLNCGRLKSILMHGMKVSFDISPSVRFEKSDLVTILNNLAVVTTAQTLKMGATNLAKLTDEEKAIATNKGWTLQ